MELRARATAAGDPATARAMAVWTARRREQARATAEAVERAAEQPEDAERTALREGA
jgi:hypothetical protein